MEVGIGSKIENAVGERRTRHDMLVELEFLEELEVLAGRDGEQFACGGDDVERGGRGDGTGETLAVCGKPLLPFKAAVLGVEA